MRPDVRVGYVTKVFPRLSETFIVSELLAQERAGLDVEVFSLRPSVDRGAHASHARLLAPVTYLPSDGITVGTMLGALEEAHAVGDPDQTVLDAWEESPRELVQALRLACVIRERSIGHLHVHFANVAATVGRLAARLAGVPYTITAHAKDIFHEDVRRAQLRRLLDDASAVITVSDFNVEHLRREFPALAARVHRVYNGLELDRFPFSSPDARPPRIVAVGRLVEKKGFCDLIDACAVLARDGRRFECRIVGQGVLEEELRARVRDHGLESVVTITGPASEEVVRAEMTAAAALAAPCVVGSDGNRDGLPTVVLEAMALGTPVVGTDVTGLPEVLEQERTGLVVPQRCPRELAGALARVLDDAALRVRVARRARELVEERFDVDRNAAALRAVMLGRRTEEADARRVRVR
jgi:glycosyltransferase involved in cell wall biosynthesis